MFAEPRDRQKRPTSADGDADEPDDRGRGDAPARDDAGPHSPGQETRDRADGDEENAGAGGFLGWLLGR